MAKGKVATDEAVPKAVAKTFTTLQMYRNGEVWVHKTKNEMPNKHPKLMK
jgi:hypothetical protein